MKPVDSTYKILAYKALKVSVDGEWISWAEEMLNAGFDTEHLVILAGERPVYNQFEMERLTNKVFEELGLDYSNTTKVMNNYIYFLVGESLSGETSFEKVLKSIYHLSIGEDWEANFRNFHLLHWALGNLDYSEEQHYWPGADRTNINEVIMNYFIEWKKNYENANT